MHVLMLLRDNWVSIPPATRRVARWACVRDRVTWKGCGPQGV